jgi:hypothetical protein
VLGDPRPAPHLLVTQVAGESDLVGGEPADAGGNDQQPVVRQRAAVRDVDVRRAEEEVQPGEPERVAQAVRRDPGPDRQRQTALLVAGDAVIGRVMTHRPQPLQRTEHPAHPLLYRPEHRQGWLLEHRRTVPAERVVPELGVGAQSEQQVLRDVRLVLQHAQVPADEVLGLLLHDEVRAVQVRRRGVLHHPRAL